MVDRPLNFSKKVRRHNYPNPLKRKRQGDKKEMKGIETFHRNDKPSYIFTFYPPFLKIPLDFLLIKRIKDGKEDIKIKLFFLK